MLEPPQAAELVVVHSRRVIVALARAVEILSAIRREDDKNGLWFEPKRGFFVDISGI
jgi:hypothetical protein